MINYLRPKSKTFRTNSGITLLMVASFVAGLVLIFQPFRPAISDQLNSGAYLPDNPNPYLLSEKPELLNDLHLPTNQIAYARINPETVNDSAVNKTQPSVRGMSFSESAIKELSSQTNKINKIIIPKMGVDAKIWEGISADTLWKGIWRMPVGSTPDESGNTVITAHRYWRRPPHPETFYNIHKMEIGDIIIIVWEGQKYEYAVSEIKIVDPDAVEILHNTPNKQLTIFSCTPLFTSDKRHVVVAVPI